MWGKRREEKQIECVPPDTFPTIPSTSFEAEMAYRCHIQDLARQGHLQARDKELRYQLLEQLAYAAKKYVEIDEELYEETGPHYVNEGPLPGSTETNVRHLAARMTFHAFLDKVFPSEQI